MPRRDNVYFQMPLPGCQAPIRIRRICDFLLAAALPLCFSTICMAQNVGKEYLANLAAIFDAQRMTVVHSGIANRSTPEAILNECQSIGSSDDLSRWLEVTAFPNKFGKGAERDFHLQSLTMHFSQSSDPARDREFHQILFSLSRDSVAAMTDKYELFRIPQSRVSSEKKLDEIGQREVLFSIYATIAKEKAMPKASLHGGVCDRLEVLAVLINMSGTDSGQGRLISKSQRFVLDKGRWTLGTTPKP